MPAVAVPVALCLAIACALLPATAHAQTAPTAVQAPAAAASSFNTLLDTQTMGAINADPELRTVLGISGDGVGDSSDRLTDVSLAQREVNRRMLADNLAAITAWKGGAVGCPAAAQRWPGALVLPGPDRPDGSTVVGGVVAGRRAAPTRWTSCSACR
jgi:hypothetical protein